MKKENLVWLQSWETDRKAKFRLIMKYRYIDAKGKNYIVDLLEDPLGLFLFLFTHVYKTKIYKVSQNYFEINKTEEKKNNILFFFYMILGVIAHRLLNFRRTALIELSMFEAILVFIVIINILFFGLKHLARKDKWRQKIVNEGYACFKINNPLVVFGEIIAALLILYLMKETLEILGEFSISALFFGIFCAFLIILFPSILLIFAEGIYNGEKLKQKNMGGE